MGIDWMVVAVIGGPIAGAVVGAWAAHRFENRPDLISYYMHVSAFVSRLPDGGPLQVNTHSIVLCNVGRRSATNVRLHHMILPDFNIWPQIPHQVETLPDGSKDIVIPALVPKEQIIVSYLYFPPTTANQVNAGIKSDQGFAHQINVILQRQYPLWVVRLVGALLVVGGITVVYCLYLFALWVVRFVK